ncbi:histone deacetylase [Tilletia horrida]|nr:histone deacetylase [Tilletia horrida]
MPLIVKLRRPGGGGGGAAAAAHGVGPATPTEEVAAMLPIAAGPITPSLAAATPAAAGLSTSPASGAHDTFEDDEEPGHEVAMADVVDEAASGPVPMHVKVETGPRTPGLRSEDIKSPIDTAMRDSTPILEKPPAMLPITAAAAAASSKELPVPPASVDVLIAPSCLQHRYVRSYDISTIVERPERLRAVMLGISAAIGRAQTSGLTPAPRSGWSKATKEDVVQQAVANGADEELADYLQRMSLSKVLGASYAPAVNVWLSSRALSLQPPDPAVAFVHAHPEEEIEPSVPEYAAARGATLEGVMQIKVEVADAQVKLEDGGQTETRSEITTGVTFASYLAELCRVAPSAPPDRGGGPTSLDDPDRTLPGPHPSEIPADLPQGDLYLRGPTDGGAEGGSGEAIRHALGACAEAVDRVVLASENVPLSPSSTSSSPSSSPGAQNGHATLLRLPTPEDNNNNNNNKPGAALPGVVTQPAPSKRNFVLTRPPGHHCSGNQPAGFCWTSNAVVAAAHAYIQHGIDRVVILDIDLHHGNGTQALAWRINNETLHADQAREERIAEHQRALAHTNSPKANRHSTRKAAAAGAKHPPEDDNGGLEATDGIAGSGGGSTDGGGLLPLDLGPRGLKIFYGSLHDIESYPCETGDAELVRDASTCIAGAHGQWIWNVHLDSYASEAEFDALYASKYTALFTQARHFLRSTAADPARTLLILSAGFDACVHEYSTMSRHGRSVPVSFYARFAQDTVALAEEGARGKVVSILEGGYSDRALCSAAMALVGGLAGYGPGAAGVEEADAAKAAEWWELDSLAKLEKAAKKAAAAAAAAAAALVSSGAGNKDAGGGGGSANSTPLGPRRRAHPAPTAANPAWLQSAMAVFGTMERATGLRAELLGDATTAAGGGGAGSGRVLRDRTRVGRVVSGAAAVTGTPTGSPAAASKIKHEVV